MEHDEALAARQQALQVEARAVLAELGLDGLGFGPALPSCGST